MGFSMHQAGGDLKTFPQTVAKIPQFNRKNVFHVLSSEGLVCSVHMVDWVRLFEVSIKLYSGFDDMASTKTENSSITDQILLDNHFAFCALDVWIRIRLPAVAIVSPKRDPLPIGNVNCSPTSSAKVCSQYFPAFGSPPSTPNSCERSSPTISSPHLVECAGGGTAMERDILPTEDQHRHRDRHWDRIRTGCIEADKGTGGRSKVDAPAAYVPRLSKLCWLAWWMVIALQIATICQCVPLSGAENNIPESEILTLSDLYQSTNGDSWAWSGTGNKWNFTNPNPCKDSWQGVTCSDTAVGGYLHVLYLQLPSFAMRGSIPESIGNLTELFQLDLSGNFLSGSMPNTLGQCTHLELLYLFSNQLTGSIPNSLGQCSKLLYLYLYLNHHLTGEIPESIGQCSQLKELLAYGNMLTGHIPDTLGQCTQLTYLYLFDNMISGGIPDSLGQCAQLEYLYLNNNQLTGAIPDSLGLCTQLVALILNNNLLTNRIPDTLDQCAQLTELILNDNFLTGSIPESLGLCVKLTELHLFNNLLTDSIPTSLGQCTQLIYLDLSTNLLTGTIPESLGQCTQLQQLILYTNQLKGNIPANLGQCTELIVLYLNSNQLTGAIPDALGQCSMLTYLYIHNNYLNSSIPASLGQCSQLKELYAYNNMLTGHIPDTLGQCTQLAYLYLNSNQLAGTIPKSLSQCKQLYGLLLYANLLSGSIPESLGQCTELNALALNNNNLVGSIPAALGNCTQLTGLALSTNYLTGRIPDSLEQCAQLSVLAVDNNQLTGPLPVFLFTAGVHHSIRALQCHSNYLTGKIPEILVGTLSYELLRVGDNFLSGSIPSSFLDALCNISQLYLNDNQFMGSLPQNWTAMATSIRSLYLQNNQLDGTVPESLGHLPQLQSLNLSSNHLTGTIPASFQQLAALQSLFLQDNQLRGSITQVFSPTQGNLSVVQLSNNQLTSTLPSDAFLLPRLSSFAAVDNCLEGPLPEQAICSSQSLAALVLDGMHSASSCRRSLSLTVKSFKLGTVPQCLLAISNLTTLHLSGSGLTGSIPAGTNISARLTDLSLSHNLLTGKVPASILGRDWAKLDLSYNRLTGTLSSARGAPYGNATQLSLQHNRLSGVIPGSMQRVGTLFLLDSNMFSCQADHSNLPPQDTESSKYTCGSDAVNNALYVWLGLVLVVVAAALFVVLYRSDILTEVNTWLTYANSVHDGQLPGASSVLRVAHLLCLLGAACAAYCVLVLLPVYITIDVYYPTFNYKYAWTVSGAFLSGTTAFVLEAAFLSILIVLCGLLVVRLGLISDRLILLQLEGGAAAAVASVKRNLQRVLLNTLLMVFSLSVVVGINVGFVIATLNLSGRVLTVIQILLALFKLGFNSIAAPALKRRVGSLSPAGDGGYLAQRISISELLLLLLVLLNVIVLPCLVVGFISPVCYYDALNGSDPVTSSYSFTGACSDPELSLSPNGDIHSVVCVENEIEVDQTSYTPPFTYSYQCSSSFITYYAPTFVAMCVISCFLVPMQRIFLLWLLRTLSPTSRLHKWVTVATPRILRELPSAEASTQTRSDPLNNHPVFDANKLVVVLLTYLALMLTFGALFPPLAVCCAVAMASTVLTARLEVGRYLAAAVAADRQDCQNEIESSCINVTPPQQLRTALAIVLTVSCLFYTLFLFDTLGDAVGFADAFWVLIVVPTLSMVALALHAAAHTRKWRPAVEELPMATPALSTWPVDPELGVELRDSQSAKGALSKEQSREEIAASSNPIHDIPSI